MENKMETTIVYGGYIGIMENKMETTYCIGATTAAAIDGLVCLGMWILGSLFTKCELSTSGS